VSAAVIARAAFAGAACGARAMTGPAAVTAARPAGLPPWLPRLAAVLAAGELVADKLPMAPSRLEPAGLSARLVTAAACALQLARTEPNPTASGQRVLAVVAATAAATASARLGSRWRATGWARHRPVPAALLEDAVAVLIGVAAVRD
jgi:uncharacterized membrane protein